MAQTTFSVHMDETPITREGAMKAFLDLRTQARENGITDMSLEDINAEINLTRQKANP